MGDTAYLDGLCRQIPQVKLTVFPAGSERLATTCERIDFAVMRRQVMLLAQGRSFGFVHRDAAIGKPSDQAPVCQCVQRVDGTATRAERDLLSRIFFRQNPHHTGFIATDKAIGSERRHRPQPCRGHLTTLCLRSIGCKHTQPAIRRSDKHAVFCFRDAQHRACAVMQNGCLPGRQIPAAERVIAAAAPHRISNEREASH